MSELSPDFIVQLLAMAPKERAVAINATTSGFDAQLGQVFESVGSALCVATLTVGPQHLQPYGLVHGGVYAALVESACSLGCAIGELAEGRHVVGLENTTRFIQGTRLGATLRIEARPTDARPKDAGKKQTSWVGSRREWEATIFAGEGVVCATGVLRLAALDSGVVVGGEAMGLPE
ncbi:MAG: PaaI family thioesterase [Nannocystaceae bacterium]|nr:PaaI family thioesterase [Nannocystaceae bacterium]